MKFYLSNVQKVILPILRTFLLSMSFISGEEQIHYCYYSTNLGSRKRQTHMIIQTRENHTENYKTVNDIFI